jgi:putative nucleotidyltransferase with HDIG domain
MLKKISSAQLKPGMYLHELCSEWIANPFWQKSFLLTEQDSIDKILAAQISEAWIDTTLGDDVAAPSASDHQSAPPAAPIEVLARLDDIAPVSMADELGRAGRIVDNSRQAVASMFREARMGNAVSTAEAMPVVEEIAASVMRNPGALIGLVRLKSVDDYTYMHSVAVCALMIALARQLGRPDAETRELGMAGLLHDIGKMAIAAEILQKPGKLTDAEFTTIKTHPQAGLEMLEHAEGISALVRDVCLHHHEKMDGSGYPEGLAGAQISLPARMGAVCDVYDAITSDRPYKRGWCPAEALQKMSTWTPAHLDPDVFQAFVRSIGIYPVGTLVQLSSGRLGVVVEQSAGKSLLLPKVRVFFSARSKVYIPVELVDLARLGGREQIISREDNEHWGLKEIDRYWRATTDARRA